MADVSNKTIVALLAVALVVTVAGTMISVSKLSQLGGTFTSLTGAITGTGESNVTLAGTVDISVTDNFINFGSGYVNSNASIANLSSITGNRSTWTGWVNTTGNGGVNDSFEVQNNGTTLFQLNLSATSDAHAEAWLCEADACSSALASLAVIAADDTDGAEVASCAVSLQDSLVNMLNTTTKYTVQICGEQSYVDANDELVIYLKAQVPADAQTGARALALTFTATDSTTI